MANEDTVNRTYLDLIDECDNFPYNDGSQSYQDEIGSYFQFMLSDCPVMLGYIPEEIARKFPLTSDWKRDEQAKKLIFQPQGTPSNTTGALKHRNAVMAQYLQELREQKIFEVLAGWRNELYPIYGPGRELLLSMERSATPLFGVVTYGVHMTAYVSSPDGMKIWTPKRSPTKQTFPGMMDNTVAGGLSTGEQPGKCIIRESMEEASLPEGVVQAAKPCGTLTYFYRRTASAGGEIGLCQPECQYIYDLEVSHDVIPKPNDNEAVDFQALSVDEVKLALAQGKFKPNCAMLLVEFFVRHGIITAENVPDYIQIVSRLHRRLEFPTI